MIATLGLAVFGQAYVLIEDFTVGEYQSVVNWPKTTDQHEEAGLDRAHTVFGSWAYSLDIMSNFDHAPTSVDIGSGIASVTTGSHALASQFDIELGYKRDVVVDFSAESEFWVDQYTVDPAERLADRWSIYVIDQDGHDAASGAFISRNGGIRFKKSNFAGSVDWSRIVYLDFLQKFTPDDGTVPLVYATTRLYAVPEPTSAIVIVAVISALRRAVRVYAGSLPPHSTSRHLLSGSNPCVEAKAPAPRKSLHT